MQVWNRQPGFEGHVYLLTSLHDPPEHLLAVVQASSSSQEIPLAEAASNTQPVAGLHESTVHTLPSLQTFMGPPLQNPFWHVSPWVHTLPSSHEAPFLLE
jgi:hypothetical protein